MQLKNETYFAVADSGKFNIAGFIATDRPFSIFKVISFKTETLPVSAGD
jgi:hypothetical protein